MTDEALPSDQLSEALRLSTLLAERVLDALIMEHPIPGEQALALAKAARFLQDHAVEWPPLLTQVVHEMANRRKQVPVPDAEASNSPSGIFAGGLSRLFAKPRPEADEP